MHHHTRRRPCFIRLLRRNKKKNLYVMLNKRKWKGRQRIPLRFGDVILLLWRYNVNIYEKNYRVWTRGKAGNKNKKENVDVHKNAHKH